jgi:hypothetical protein
VFCPALFASRGAGVRAPSRPPTSADCTGIEKSVSSKLSFVRAHCARTVRHWMASVHNGAVEKYRPLPTGVISFARRLSFSSASRFIFSFICECFYSRPWACYLTRFAADLFVWRVFQGRRSMTFCFSNSLITTSTSFLITFIGESALKVLVVPVHTSSPSGFAVE